MYGNASAYEAYMGRWSALLAPSFLAFSGARPGAPMLDIGCGTGSLLAVAMRSGPGGALIGLDPVTEFLAHARGRCGIAAQLVAGRCDAMPFADSRFASCLSLLFVQEVDDRVGALAEMVRVTRPGGTIAACQWDFADGMSMLAMVGAAIAAFEAQSEVSELASRSAAVASEAEFGDWWRSGGLAEVDTATLAVRRSFRDFDELWSAVVQGPTPTTRRVAQMDRLRQEEVRRHLCEAMTAGATAESFTLAARAFAVRGRVPAVATDMTQAKAGR